MSSYCYFLLAAYQKNLKYCFEIMLIFCYQLSSDCMQPVSNRCPTFLILLIFLPGNHGLHVGLAVVMTCNNAIFTHRMLPVPKTTFCKRFPILPRFCSKKDDMHNTMQHLFPSNIQANGTVCTTQSENYDIYSLSL